ncbi:MAG: YceI family protein [Bdellovibrionales bacterium]|nr:YceI family protein [Bdellovibrionales bacterium]
MGLLKKISIILCLAYFPWVQAEPLSGSWEVKSGELTYHVHFVLKNIEGVSKEVKGKGQCEKKECQFLLAVPVKSFLSGDTNRDFHMLEVTKAPLHPMVTVRLKVPAEWTGSKIISDVDVQFAGKSKTYKSLAIEVVNQTDQSAEVKGVLPMSLDDFSIEPPSLLGVEIEKKVPVDFTIYWSR